jgi:hypothetical protein
LNQDSKVLLSAFITNDVAILMVGANGFAAHGHVRAAAFSPGIVLVGNVTEHHSAPEFSITVMAP